MANLSISIFRNTEGELFHSRATVDEETEKALNEVHGLTLLCKIDGSNSVNILSIKKIVKDIPTVRRMYAARLKSVSDGTRNAEMNNAEKHSSGEPQAEAVV